ncbi:hypothetical protein FB451DRAFT_1367660 [Mycena latifolia]|nr:hypothetical protein FB451DRAFT_1367660 [Mycena latifolia]
MIEDQEKIRMDIYSIWEFRTRPKNEGMPHEVELITFDPRRESDTPRSPRLSGGVAEVSSVSPNGKEFTSDRNFNFPDRLHSFNLDIMKGEWYGLKNSSGGRGNLEWTDASKASSVTRLTRGPAETCGVGKHYPLERPATINGSSARPSSILSRGRISNIRPLAGAATSGLPMYLLAVTASTSDNFPENNELLRSPTHTDKRHNYITALAPPAASNGFQRLLISERPLPPLGDALLSALISVSLRTQQTHTALRNRWQCFLSHENVDVRIIRAAAVNARIVDFDKVRYPGFHKAWHTQSHKASRDDAADEEANLNGALFERRKLRCDGGDPCGHCSRTRTPVTCTYVPKTVGQLRSELPKGGACISCRQRKRRCDGNLPCRTCKQTLRPHECQYRETKSKPRQPAVSSDSTSSSSSSRPGTPSLHSTTQNSVALRLHEDYTDLDDLFDPLFPWPDLSCSTSSETLYALPTFLDSIAVPCSPLDSMPPDAKLLSLRNLFLDHRWKYGLSVTTAKYQALAVGDSGLVVDPTLANVCELMGYLIHHHSHPEAWLSTNSQTTAEAELYLSICDKLEGAPGLAPDPLLCLQAYTLLVLYCAQKEDLRGILDFIKKGSDLVLRHAATLGLEDSPALEWCPQFDDSYLSPRSVAEEVRAAFSHLIYVDAASRVVLNVDSAVDPGLVEKFRRLAAVYWSDTELNLMRAKSTLFLADSKLLVEEWNRCGGPAPSAWSKRYWSLIEDIHAHINFINTAMVDVSCIPELHGAQVTLKLCMILAMAALAEAYGLFAPSQPELRQKHREAVTGISTITKGISDADYPYLDPTIGVCWSIASRQLYDDEPVEGDLRIGAQLHECYRKLRQASPYAPPP